MHQRAALIAARSSMASSIVMATAGEYDEPADDLARPGNKKRDRHSNKLIRRLRGKRDTTGINFSAAEKEEIDSIKWVAAGSGRGGGH